MAVVLNTEDQPAAQRLDYWRHIVSDILVPVQMHTENTTDYRGRLSHSDLGAVRFTEKTASPLVVTRTPDSIRSSDPGHYMINMHTRGSSIVSQDGRETALHAGDFTVVDTGRPYRIAAGYPRNTNASEPPCLLSLLIPRTMLPQAQRSIGPLTAIGFSGRSPVGRLITGTLTQLARHATAGRTELATRLATVMSDLLAVGLAGGFDRSSAVAPQTHAVAPETHRDVLLRRINAFIETHLADPELDPATVAAAHYISTRYLHKLFRTQEATIAEHIRNRRLEQCRRELTDPNLPQRTVAAIATRWGFGSPAHFSRVFLATYGQPPAHYRAHHSTPNR